MIKEKVRSIKIVAIVAILLLSAVLSFVPTCMQAYAKEALLAKNESEFAALIRESNVDIPQDFNNSNQLGSFVKTTVEQVVNDPNCCFAYNYDKALQFAEDIRAWVLTTYPSATRTYSNATYALNHLQDSLVQNSLGNWVSTGGAWNDLWSNFNCYAFSINKWRAKLGGQDKPYQPGMFSGAAVTFALGNPVEAIAQLVENDLNALGMSNIVASETIPSVNSNQELICVRVGSEDYHFMKYDITTDAWYHKPGLTAVLKYKYVPSNNRIWTNEYSAYGTEHSAGLEYDSNIIFIKYDKNSKTLTSSSDTEMEINLGMKLEFAQEIKVSANVACNIKLVSNSAMRVWLSDASMTSIMAYSGTTVEINETLSAGTHILAVAFSSKESSGNVAVKMHVHDFTYRYKKIDGTYHKSLCQCSDYVTSPHTVLGGWDSNKINRCMFCGAIVEMGQIIFPNSVVLPTTDNGSYILPNGVTVLMVEDLEAYLNGTLKFRVRNQSAA